MKTFDKGLGTQFIDGMKMDANDSFYSTVEFENGAIGVIYSSRWATGHSNSIRLEISGTNGALRIDLDKSWGELELCVGKKNIKDRKWTTISCPKTPNIYRRFIQSILTGKNSAPSFEDGVKAQEYIDKCFESSAKSRAVLIKP
jgi:predicted dehydrogenase